MCTTIDDARWPADAKGATRVAAPTRQSTEKEERWHGRRVYRAQISKRWVSCALKPPSCGDNGTQQAQQCTRVYKTKAAFALSKQACLLVSGVVQPLTGDVGDGLAPNAGMRSYLKPHLTKIATKKIPDLLNIVNPACGTAAATTAAMQRADYFKVRRARQSCIDAASIQPHQYNTLATKRHSQAHSLQGEKQNRGVGRQTPFSGWHTQ